MFMFIILQTLPWKKAAFGQYPRPSVEPSINPNSDEPRLKQIKIMGYTLRSNRYRYTAWLPFKHSCFHAVHSSCVLFFLLTVSEVEVISTTSSSTPLDFASLFLFVSGSSSLV